MSKARDLLNKFESSTPNPHNLEPGDTVIFVKDHMWKMSGDTFGWKKGKTEKVSYIDDEGHPRFGGRKNDLYNEGWIVDPKAYKKA